MIPKEHAAPGARALPRAVQDGVHGSCEDPVCITHVAVCGIGTAGVVCPGSEACFGAFFYKDFGDTTGFGLAPAPKIMSENRFDPKGPCIM